MQARSDFVVAEHATVVQQRDGTGFGGGIQGQESGHWVRTAEEKEPALDRLEDFFSSFMTVPGLRRATDGSLTRAR
jgi:hypothetical protein